MSLWQSLILTPLLMVLTPTILVLTVAKDQPEPMLWLKACLYAIFASISIGGFPLGLLVLLLLIGSSVPNKQLKLLCVGVGLIRWLGLWFPPLFTMSFEWLFTIFFAFHHGMKSISGSDGMRKIASLVVMGMAVFFGAILLIVVAGRFIMGLAYGATSDIITALLAAYGAALLYCIYQLYTTLKRMEALSRRVDTLESMVKSLTDTIQPPLNHSQQTNELAHH